MKSVVAVLLYLCSFHTAYTQTTITSKGSGDWQQPSTWDRNRVPSDNDIVVIQSGHEITVSRNVTLRNLNLRIIGILKPATGVSISLNATSVINVISGGRIEADQAVAGTAIFIGTQAKFRGNRTFNQSWGVGKLLGLAYATSSTGDIDQSGAGFFLGNPPATWQELRIFVTQEEQVQLIWVTSHETSARSFRIQRSQDAQNWKEIGNIESAGSMSAQNIYSFVDNAPGAGTFFYRLLEYTPDGLYKVSAVRSARLQQGSITQKIFPNPARHSAQIRFPALQSAASMQIFSMDGRLMSSKTLQAGSTGLQLELAGWPAGTYAIQVVTGAYVLSQYKLVKY